MNAQLHDNASPLAKNNTHREMNNIEAGSLEPAIQEKAVPAAGTTEHGEVQPTMYQCESTVPPRDGGDKTEPQPTVSVTESLALPGPLELQTPSGKVSIASLTLPQDFSELAGVTTDMTMTVHLKRPPNQSWFSPCPDQSTWLRMAMFKEDDGGDNYVVAPPMIAEMEGEYTIKLLIPCVTRAGVWYLWPIKLPGQDGKLDAWNCSALKIVEHYKGQWIRVVSNTAQGAYVPSTSKVPLDPPDWPDNVTSIMEKAFDGRIIDSVEHPILKRLRGEI